nr:hypothetical transcript [Hymenolepis microstoma]
MDLLTHSTRMQFYFYLLVILLAATVQSQLDVEEIINERDVPLLTAHEKNGTIGVTAAVTEVAIESSGSEHKNSSGSSADQPVAKGESVSNWEIVKLVLICLGALVAGDLKALGIAHAAKVKRDTRIGEAGARRDVGIRAAQDQGGSIKRFPVAKTQARCLLQGI